MNTDKLMELERKWRADGKRLFDDPRSEALNELGRGMLHCADELAAALRAEQAVGDEQRARDEWAEATKISMHDDVDDVLRDFAADPTGDNGVMVVREVMRVLRALGTARQSEFGVVPPPNPAAMVKAAYRAEALRIAHQRKDGVLVPRENLLAAAALLEGTGNVVDRREAEVLRKFAAAPGGEGEG